MIDQNGHWQQLGTSPILIIAPQRLHRPCNAPLQFYRVSKKPSVKVNLAIYSQVVDASGQCMNVSLILGFILDFSFCAILDGVVNPVTYSFIADLQWPIPFLNVYILTSG